MDSELKRRLKRWTADGVPSWAGAMLSNYKAAHKQLLDQHPTLSDIEIWSAADLASGFNEDEQSGAFTDFIEDIAKSWTINLFGTLTINFSDGQEVCHDISSMAIDDLPALIKDKILDPGTTSFSLVAAVR